jgi:hypothetical protein
LSSPQEKRKRDREREREREREKEKKKSAKEQKKVDELRMLRNPGGKTGK